MTETNRDGRAIDVLRNAHRTRYKPQYLSFVIIIITRFTTVFFCFLVEILLFSFHRESQHNTTVREQRNTLFVERRRRPAYLVTFCVCHAAILVTQTFIRVFL